MGARPVLHWSCVFSWSAVRGEVRREFFQLIPADIVDLADGPASEQPANVAIPLRIIGEENAGLS
jgi:hypothetical protein